MFIEKPLSTNVQEAADIVGLARGAALKVGGGAPVPALSEPRSRPGAGSSKARSGRLRLVTATLARPWLAAQQGAREGWRFDRKVAGGGILADAGDHLIDALLWTTGRAAAGGLRRPETNWSRGSTWSRPRRFA